MRLLQDAHTSLSASDDTGLVLDGTTLLHAMGSDRDVLRSPAWPRKRRSIEGAADAHRRLWVNVAPTKSESHPARVMLGVVDHNEGLGSTSLGLVSAKAWPGTANIGQESAVFRLGTATYCEFGCLARFVRWPPVKRRTLAGSARVWGGATFRCLSFGKFGLGGPFGRPPPLSGVGPRCRCQSTMRGQWRVSDATSINKRGGSQFSGF